jgi:predicted Zn-dependent protease
MIRRHRTIGLFLAMILGTMGLVQGCATNPVTGKKEFIVISEEQEIAMGLQAAPEFVKQFGGEIDDPLLQEYVKGVGGKVATVSDRPLDYEFVAVNSDVPNAFALPGGQIFITAGLLRLMSNERQLAAVLGHEVGHVAAKHNVKGLQRQMGASVLVEIAGAMASSEDGGTTKQAAQVVAAMTVSRYSRDDEYQADALGIKYMNKAGYNPYGMVELLNVLKSLHETEPSRLEEMFQTHPLSSKRIAEAEQLILDDPGTKQASRDAPDPRETAFLKVRNRLGPAPKLKK